MIQLFQHENHHRGVNTFTTDSDNDKITIETKDFRTNMIDSQQVQDVSLKLQYIEMLKRRTTPTDDREVFAFKAYVLNFSLLAQL